MNFHKQIFKKKLPAPPDRKSIEVSGVVVTKEDDEYFNSLFTEEDTTTSNKHLPGEQVYFSAKSELPPSPITPTSPTDTNEDYSAQESVESLPISNSAATSQYHTRPATLQLNEDLEVCSIASDGSLSSYDSPKISLDSGCSKLSEPPSHRRASHHEFSWSPFGSLKNKLSRALHHVTPTTSVKVNIEDFGATSDQRVGTYLSMHKELQKRETGLSSWLCHIKSQSRGLPNASQYFKPQTTVVSKPDTSSTDTISHILIPAKERVTSTELDSEYPVAKDIDYNNDIKSTMAETMEHGYEESARAYITPPLVESESESIYLNEMKHSQEYMQVRTGSENNSHQCVNSHEVINSQSDLNLQLTPHADEGRQSRPLPIPKPRQSNNSLSPSAVVCLTPPSPREFSNNISNTGNPVKEYSQVASTDDTHPPLLHSYYQSRPRAPVVSPYPPPHYSVYGPSGTGSSTPSVYPPESSTIYPPYPVNHYQSRYMVRSPIGHGNWNYTHSPAVNPGYPPAQQYSNTIYHPQSQVNSLDPEVYTTQ